MKSKYREVGTNTIHKNLFKIFYDWPKNVNA